MKKNRLFRYDKNRVWAESAHIIMQIGLTMAGCIMFCLFVGRQIDAWTGLKGVFTTVFIILGIIGGANVVYRQIINITEPDTKKDGSDHGNH